MKSMKSLYILMASLVITGAITGCKKEFANPNAPSLDEVSASDRAITGVATGLQKIYSTTAASSLYAVIDANGFLTNELILRNAGNTGELQLSTGGTAVDATNTVLANIWTNSNKVIADANNVIGYANQSSDKSYATGLIAYVSIFKALAIGNMCMFWEQVPDTIGQNVKFIPRADGYKKAIAVIDNALALLSVNTISTSFTNRVPAEVNIVNTLNALKARYSLYSGNYAAALAAANAVDLTKKSTFNYTSLNLNPVYESATSTNNVYQPIDSTLGLPPSLAPSLTDKRIPFYIGINPTIAPRYRINGFFSGTTTPVPIYLPGEMTLIKAECYVRQTPQNLPSAIVELNKVITKTPASDPFGVGADQPPYAGAVTQAAILDEIYRQRCIELFMSGLKLEDMRRFGRPTSERKRNFLPYPFRERDNNPNTPTDPAN